MQPYFITFLTILPAATLLAGIATGIWIALKAPWIQRKTIEIAPSTVSGRGAFALRNIKEGETIERCPALEVSDQDIGGVLLNYVFFGSTERHRLVAMGNGMLFNHSSTPNVAYYRDETPYGPELVLYANRNIAKGEELYYTYGDDWWSTRQEHAQ